MWTKTLLGSALLVEYRESTGKECAMSDGSEVIDHPTAITHYTLFFVIAANEQRSEHLKLYALDENEARIKAQPWINNHQQEFPKIIIEEHPEGWYYHALLCLPGTIP